MSTRDTAHIPVVSASETAPTTCVDAEPYALRVTDASMAPEFPQGCVVIVDPTAEPAPGRFAVAETPSGLVLRRLAAAPGGWRLEALAPGVEADSARPQDLRGVVTPRAGRRRRDHKRYP